MKCEEFESRLQDLLDFRESPNLDDQLAAHAGDCANCRRVLSATNTIFDGLALNDLHEPAASFTEQIVAEVARNELRRLPRAVGAISMLAVVAATLLLAALPGLNSLLEPKNQPGEVTNSSKKSESDSEGQLVQAVPTELGSAVIAEDSAHGSDADAEFRERFGALDLSSFSEVPHQINSDQIPGVRPIKCSFTVAFDLIRRTIPGGSKSDSTAKPHAGAMLELHQNHLT